MSDEHLTPAGTQPEAPGAGEEATPESEAPMSATATDTTSEQAEQTLPHETSSSSAPAASDADEFKTAVEAFAAGDTGTLYDDTFRPLRRGETLTATVIQVDDTGAFVDLGTKAEGKIPLEELGVGVEKASDAVKVGDQIKVVVMQTDSASGNPIVSKKRADFQATWDRLVEDFESNRMIKGFVTARVKGGLEVDVGVRGFVPASQVAVVKKKHLDRFVGQSLPLKIIDIDKERKKVVLSNRQAEEEMREERRKEFFEKIKPGEIMDGTVRRIVDYGAFVDLGGGVDGLLHVSEMAWSRVDHPREVLREGEEVKVMVLRLDPTSGRISLGRRQVIPDPWTVITEQYSVGARLTLPISRVVQNGAFVKLPEGAEAFIPASEMAHKRVSRPSDVVQPGQEVEVQIIELKPEDRRMVLSMRALMPYESPSRRDDYTRYSGGEKGGRGRDRRKGGGRQDSADGGRGTTIGERLGALRGFMTEESEQAPPDAEAAPDVGTASSEEGRPAEETSTEPVSEQQQ